MFPVKPGTMEESGRMGYFYLHLSHFHKWVSYHVQEESTQKLGDALCWCWLTEDAAMAHPLTLGVCESAKHCRAVQCSHQWDSISVGCREPDPQCWQEKMINLPCFNMNTPLCIAAQHPLSTAIQQQGRSLWVMEKNQAFICVSGYKSKQAKSRLWINPVLLHIPTVSPVVRQEHLQCPVLQDLGKLHRGGIPFPGSEAPGRQNNFHTSYCSCSRRLSPHLVSGK